MIYAIAGLIFSAFCFFVIISNEVFVFGEVAAILIPLLGLGAVALWERFRRLP